MDNHADASSSAVPPILLLVEDDADTLDMYSTYFEMSGVWVARSKTAQDALEGVAELRPDVVVTDLDLGHGGSGIDLVHALKSRRETEMIPVIVLSGEATERLPEGTRREADLCLLKPVLPDALLTDITRLAAKSAGLRRRSSEAIARSVELVQTSKDLRAYARAVRSTIESANRPCPHCGRDLEWIERGHIGGVDYDYFRWCQRGCGLYCFDRRADRWVKLA